MEIKGKVMQVLPMRTGTSQRGTMWKVQEYVLETYDQFPRKVKFDFFGERVDQYPLQPGDDVLVSFDLESRSFVGRDGVERWSTDVRAWKAEKLDPATIQAPAYGAPQPQFAQPQQYAPAPQPGVPYAQPAPAVGQFPESVPTGVPNATEDLPF